MNAFTINMTTQNHNQSNPALIKRTRTRHHKSRNGCLECKRRRVKVSCNLLELMSDYEAKYLLQCDETKPSCTRCVLGLSNCIYPPVSQFIIQNPKERFHTISPLSANILSPSTSPSISSSSFETSPCPISPFPDAPYTVKGLSDGELYHHYLQYTSRTLGFFQSDYNELYIDTSMLALQSGIVFHALLAASAASLACTMISQTLDPNTDTITQILLTGYHHYNLASEQMREAISRSENLKPEPLVASVILVPFVAASQQINHWISSRSGARCKRLSSTPRDVIVIMRGIQTMLGTLDDGSLSTSAKTYPQTDRWIDMSPAYPAITPPAPSRSHVMSAIVATTSHAAFCALQRRLDSVLLESTDPSLPACSTAFEVLKHVRNSAFGTTDSPSFELQATDSLKPKPTSWLRTFAAQSEPPHPTEPLTRFFLSFLTQAPQEYLDLVLPLLDQRLETASSPARLTQIQALALDIYAHWSVLMFLVEDESWWIGTLPVVTLSGMINRYGEGFVGRSWPNSEDQWWPGSMLNILQDIKQYR
jgi:hypothetical protein